MGKKPKESLVYRIFSVCNLILLGLLAFACIMPFLHILAVSFSDAASTAANTVGLLPSGFQTDAYKKILTDPAVFKAFGTTLSRMALGTAWSMLLTIPAAYVLSFSDREFFGRKFFVGFFFVSMLFSGGIIPYYILMKEMDLIDTIWALVLGGVPVGNMIILINFFRGLPRAIYESASLDGASHWTILTRIYLPLSKAPLATLSLFCLVGHWNDWFGGLAYIRDPEGYPLQTYIYQMMQTTGSFSDAITGDGMGAPRQAVTAGLIILSIIPVLILFPVLQKYLKDGIVLGSVKE